MFRSIYRCIAALTLTAAMALSVVAVTDNADHSAPVADKHWCC
jgi:hypothetical protein